MKHLKKPEDKRCEELPLITFNLPVLSICMRKYKLLSYNVLAFAGGGLAASQAGRGVRYAVVGAYWVPLLH